VPTRHWMRACVRACMRARVRCTVRVPCKVRGCQRRSDATCWYATLQQQSSMRAVATTIIDASCCNSNNRCELQEDADVALARTLQEQVRASRPFGPRPYSASTVAAALAPPPSASPSHSQSRFYPTRCHPRPHACAHTRILLDGALACSMRRRKRRRGSGRSKRPSSGSGRRRPPRLMRIIRAFPRRWGRGWRS
jgi:hypothetical protein